MRRQRSRMRSRRSLFLLALAGSGSGKLTRIARRVVGSFEKSRLRRAGVGGDLRWTWPAHQLVAVDIAPDLLPHAAFAEMRDRCTEILETHGISYAVTSTSRWQRHSLAIPDTEWEKALRVLAAELSSTPTYFRLEAKLLGVRVVSDYFHVGRRRAVAAATAKSQVLMSTMRARGMNTPVMSMGYGLELQRWTADELWNAPQGNQTATRVPLDAFDTTEVREEEDGPVRRFAGMPRSSFTQPRFPIDIVYLWVDGGDPVWLQERAKTLGDAAGNAEPAHGEWLFRDRDELLYSLRSLEESAPWVRKVHLLTANQVPRWLNLDHPKLKVHFHRDVFAEPQALPTYNSHAIESQIHRIPDLAEHYIVMNDDVFLGQPVAPSHFFTPGGTALFRYSRHHLPAAGDTSMSAIEQARHHTAGVIESIHGVKPHALFAHIPAPQLRTVQEQLEKEIPAEFRRTMRSRVRSGTDLVPLSWLHLNHLYLSGRAVEARYRYGYYFLANPSGRSAFARMMRARRPHVFCLNDGPDVDGNDYTEWLITELEQGFPEPSSFELPSDQWRDSVHMDVARGEVAQ